MPPAAPEIATASLVLSSLILLVAGLLGWREWSDRRARDPDLSPEDYAHFAGQDARRSLGIVVLVLLAAGVAVGSRTPHRVGNQANPQFAGIWLAVFVLIFVLLSLALLDWLALRVFAHRHPRRDPPRANRDPQGTGPAQEGDR